MRLFLETADGKLPEIFDFGVEEEIENQKLQEVARAILKLELPVSKEFEYISIVNSAGATEIRYVQNRRSCDPWNQGREQKIGRDVGLFACFFQGSAISPEEIPHFVREHIMLNWISINEDAIREISNLFSFSR